MMEPADVLTGCELSTFPASPNLPHTGQRWDKTERVGNRAEMIGSRLMLVLYVSI